MYRVIVVDDEIWSVIGLKKILQEESRRFELVYETTDPVDALEQICALRPDVVFTDVRMPEMSGIDLMRKVKQHGIKTEFVVISGFAEFTYVQQALQEGAIDYQLKPFDRSTAKQMLDKVYEKLDRKNDLTGLELYSLLRDRNENVPSILQSRFEHSLYKKLQIVFLFYKRADSREVKIDAGENSQCLVLRIGPRKSFYLINSDEDKTDAIFRQLREQEAEMEKAAISRVGVSVNSFEQLVKEAETTIMDSFVYPRGKIFLYRRPNRGYIHQLEEHISALDAERKYKKIGAIVDILPKVYADHNMGVEDAVYFWNRIVLAANTWAKGSAVPLEHLDLYELTDQFSDMQEMCSYINAQFEHKRVEQSGTVNDKFFELLRYIDQNYDKYLSLKELCNMFYINMSYCCELFQKHKNMTFSQYLTEVRINKACELLRYHRSTVAEACELVGYKDYFYFNKVFKKKMGCTPAEYRKNVLTEG